MRIRLEQVFYGCGSRGYAVLGVTSGAKPFAAHVEVLCGAVGTPVADYGGEPFLLSVPDSNHVLMICGRRGAPDSIGRGTLFFHALIGLRNDLDAAKANAFELFDQGAFAARMPDGKLDALHIDAKPVGADRRAARNGRDDSTNHPPDGRAVGVSLPCFVRSSSPAPDAVRLLIGDHANRLSWATFAFRSMSGFDIQVLPPRIPAPNGMNECNSEGNLLHGAAPTSFSPREGMSRGDRGENIGIGGPPGGRPLPRPSSTILNLSVAANVALALCCVVLWSTRSHTSQDHSDEPRVVTNKVETIVKEKDEDTKTVEILREPSPAETNAIGQVAVNAFRKQLVEDLNNAIPMNRRIKDFKEEKAQIPFIKEFSADYVPDGYDFLNKLAQYVAFVNTLTNLQENAP